MVAEVTANELDNWVVPLRSSETFCPLGTGMESGEPLCKAPVVVLKVSVPVASGPEL